MLVSFLLSASYQAYQINVILLLVVVAVVAAAAAV